MIIHDTTVYVYVICIYIYVHMYIHISIIFINIYLNWIMNQLTTGDLMHLKLISI